MNFFGKMLAKIHRRCVIIPPNYRLWVVRVAFSANKVAFYHSKRPLFYLSGGKNTHLLKATISRRNRRKRNFTVDNTIFTESTLSVTAHQLDDKIGQTMPYLAIFSGNAHPALAKQVTEHLHIPLGRADVTKFSDGEIAVEIQENVRGKDVFILQPTCYPTNDNLMEIMVMADALRRASAGRITAVMPYFGYARQDRRPRSARVPISAKVVADMLNIVSIDRVVTVDLHSDQIQGFFDIPVDNIYGTPVLLKDLKEQKYENLMVVSPDVGGVVRARAMAKSLGIADLAIIDKRRAKANEAEVMHLIGDVKDRDCVIVDDMVDTAGTLAKAAAALKAHGARRVVAYITHPVLSGKAIDNINASDLDEIVVTDTIPLQDPAKNCAKIRQVSIAPMLAEALRRINNEESLSAMFDII